MGPLTVAVVEALLEAMDVPRYIEIPERESPPVFVQPLAYAEPQRYRYRDTSSPYVLWRRRAKNRVARKTRRQMRAR